MHRKLVQGGSLAGFNESLTVRHARIISYNLLADCYISDGVFWNHIPEHLKQWASHRRPLQRSLLIDRLASSSDIVCLQEADSYSFHDDFGALFEANGKKYVQQGVPVLKQSNKKSKELHRVSCVISYDKEKFQLVEEDHRSRCLIVALKVLAEKDLFLYVINVHLEGHPDLEDQRFLQLSSSLKCLSKMIRRLEPYRKDFPAVVICGDFNSTPSESIFKLLYSGMLHANAKHPCSVGEDIVVTKTEYHLPCTFECALEESELEYIAKKFQDCAESQSSIQGLDENIKFSFYVNQKRRLDFIWYNSAQLICSAVMEIYKEDKDLSSLPNLEHPSDHLPVGAILRFIEK